MFSNEIKNLFQHGSLNCQKDVNNIEIVNKFNTRKRDAPGRMGQYSADFKQKNGARLSPTKGSNDTWISRHLILRMVLLLKLFMTTCRSNFSP